MPEKVPGSFLRPLKPLAHSAKPQAIRASFHGSERIEVTLQQRVARELFILAMLSAGFLTVFPRRPIVVDMGLALFALSVILVTANHTRSAIWGPLPVEGTASCWRRCARSTLLLTALAATVFLIVGAIIAYQAAGWVAVRYRILHPRLPTAVALYFPWAFLQQAVFLFYLLGRVRVLLPSLPPLGQSALNGLAFGLVHVPDLWVALLASLGGTVWSALYLRYRLLWPLALSHALLGTTFYYWVYAHDLAGTWIAVLTRW